MKIELWAIGKTSEPYLETGTGIFEKRIRNYLPFTWTALPDVRAKAADPARLKSEDIELSRVLTGHILTGGRIRLNLNSGLAGN